MGVTTQYGDLKERGKELYVRYRSYLPVAAFVFGLSFDALSLENSSPVWPMVQHGLYLTVLSVFLISEIFGDAAGWRWPWVLGSVQPHREELSHFLFGSLLSAYTVFYFMSASIWSSLVFFLLITGCLIANEFSVFRRLGTVMRSALLGLCLTSYLCYLVPVLWGRIGLGPFLVALAAASGLLGGLAWLLIRWTKDKPRVLSRFAMPAGGVLVTFLALYFLKWIPPVPLSLGHVGIYHGVQVRPGKGEDRYVLEHQKPPWKFWETGDQTFHARAGDRIYCFFSVIAPGGFSERLRVRWLFDDERRGWVSSDAIPVTIHGGREEGYRGYTYKRNYEPGDWQVRIETSDGREVGRISLTVVAEPAS